ncbi:DUF5984 family protein [Actinoplanes lobatus]|uniref:Uncharacterized protein n=1 Tax=Actinoplanes lobatus TaxID=113568 RepID=A0A7W7HJQ8_9ACTN|nr:DUF5984 family protein [Actinoplanes lobatus]MBB4751811.1 hypothetical protein [Actinoplanes lobatus]
MLRFQFECRPLADVSPWGRSQLTLHWFGLSEGWFWFDSEDREVLRYRDEAVRRWDLERPYPDYYIARMWEDLILLRWVLEEPVPDDLVPFVDGTFPSREIPDDDVYGDDVDVAFSVQSDFNVYLGYLAQSPTLKCWRHSVEGGDVVTLSQQLTTEEASTFDGPPRLEFSLPAAEFFAAVEDFDRRFITAMEERVVELERSGPPAGVALDLDDLRREHLQRSRWLEQRLSEPRKVDWAAVRNGVAEICSWPSAVEM